MSKELLDRAYDLIIYEKYDEARNILEGLRDRSSTARRWLANLPGDDTGSTEEDISPQIEAIGEAAESSVEDDLAFGMTEDALDDDSPFDEPDLEIESAFEPEDAEIASFVEESIFEDEDGFDMEDDDFGLGDDDFIDDVDEFIANGELNAEMESVAGATLEDLEQERELRFDDPQPEILPMVAEAAPMEDEPPANETSLPANDLMPIDETADVLPADEFMPSDGRTRWEYREIVLKDWNQHISNIEYALEQGGEKITIEDAYTKLLNESGAQGWEVVTEEVLPQQYVRLLMKRLVTS